MRLSAPFCRCAKAHPASLNKENTMARKANLLLSGLLVTLLCRLGTANVSVAADEPQCDGPESAAGHDTAQCPVTDCTPR